MMLEQHIEALIFASEKPITAKEIKACLQESFGWEITDEDFDKAIEAIKEKYLADAFSFHLIMSGGGYEFMTKKDYAPVINTFLNQKAKKRLTRAALETLSIIAYKQPITKMEIEQIRGVNCDYTVQKLLEKELIVIAGRAETVGHPLTYATSEQFMDYFGINSPADLPKLREIEAGHDNEIGTAPSIEEDAPADEPASNETLENDNLPSDEASLNEENETPLNEENTTDLSEENDTPLNEENNDTPTNEGSESASDEENKDEVQDFREEQLEKLHGKKRKELSEGESFEQSETEAA